MLCWNSADRALGRVLLLLAGMVGMGSLARGHDFWLQPASFEPALEKVTALYLMVGDGFLGEPVAREEDYIRTFVACTAGERKDVAGMAGRSPAGLLRVDSAKVVVAGYESRPRYLELAADKFLSYLKEEGLEAVIAERRERGEAGEAAKERFVRCAKTLLRPAGAKAKGFDARLGLGLEFVPLVDPWASDKVRFVLLENGEPLAGVLVSATVKDRAEGAPAPVHVRTGADGVVELDLRYAGQWLIAGTWMRRVEDGDGKADWASCWASVTLRRG